MEIMQEISGADLGDRRLGERLAKVVAALAVSPSRSLPKVFRTHGELEAVYRFLNNERVSPEGILVPHQLQTRKRIVEAERVVIAHDTSEFTGASGVSFFCHVALAMTADAGHRPLGVIGQRTFVRGEKKPRVHPRQRRADADRESLRWWEQVAEVEATLSGDAQTMIHVMDREADIYELLANMVEAKYQFVVRSRADRLLDDDKKLFARLDEAPCMAKRIVPLSPRKGSRLPKQRRCFPARAGRTAILACSAMKVVLRRPDGLPHDQSDTLAINVVLVRETDPPDGEQPVCWRLLTSEPIDTNEQMLAVVDHYRCRWMIEEYFKALKTGCAVENRQVESVGALLNLMAVSIPIAWQLLMLRFLSRDNGEAPGDDLLPPRQLRVLRLACKTLPAAPTRREVLMAVAALGGHIKNNGDPGWQVLARGYDDLLLLERGYALSTLKNCDQS
jgi:hypothetical protein